MRTLQNLTLTLACLPALACTPWAAGGSSSSGSSPASSSAGSGSSSGGASSSAGSSSGGSGGCLQVAAADLDPVILDGQDDTETGYSMRVRTNVATPIADYLVIKIVNQGDRVEMPAGTFPLGSGINANTGTCAECLNLFVDQVSPFSAPAKLLFQSAGTITLQTDPRRLVLRGTVSGLRLVEVMLDAETQSSTPVPGGLCADVADLTWDFKYVPPQWTCPDSQYRDGTSCQCGCGVDDPDCYCDVFGPECATNPPPPAEGCTNSQTCVYGACLETCDVKTNVGCSTGVCTLEAPTDVCRAPSPDVLDVATLGAMCVRDDRYNKSCAALAGVARGRCDGEDFVCRPACAGRMDCAPDEFCYTLVVDQTGTIGKGYCKQGVDPSWLCEDARWRDGAFCDCECGTVDPDCDSGTLPVRGCDGGQCNAAALCGP